MRGLRHATVDDQERLVSDAAGVQGRLTAEGYRLVWYHSARKAALDALARHKRLERVSMALAGLRAK